MAKTICLSKKALDEAIRFALAEARAGSRAGHGGPFGAVVMSLGGGVVGRGHNTVLRDKDATRHAEMNAISAACRHQKTPHLTDCVLVASSEPCPMCLAAADWAGVKAVYFGLPRRVAARAGFRDDQIYRELAKPSGRRLVPVKRIPDVPTEGLRIFSDWQEDGGKLY